MAELAPSCEFEVIEYYERQIPSLYLAKESKSSESWKVLCDPERILAVVLDDENWIEVYGPNQNVNAVIAGSSSALFWRSRKFKIY